MDPFQSLYRALPPRAGLHACLLAAGVVAGACRPGMPATTDPGEVAVPVRVETISWTREAPVVEAEGTLGWRDVAGVGFPQGGVLGEVRVRVGDRVEAGQVLASLRRDDLEGRLRQARAAVGRWSSDVDRGKRLLAEGVLTREQLQHLESALADAEGQLQAALHGLDLAEIRASDTGWVLERLGEPGQVVGAGVPVLRMAGERGGWLARLHASELAARSIQAGDAVQLWLDESGDPVPGRVERVSSGVDERTRQVLVEVAVATVPGRVRSGVPVRAWIRPAGLVRPRAVFAASALVEGRGREAWVHEVVGGRCVRRPVTVERLAGERAEVTGGLADGARVVVLGAELVREGALVREVEGGGRAGIEGGRDGLH